MSEMSLESPLYDSDLEGAAYICFEEAATTNLDHFPAGSGNLSRRRSRERGARFKEALERRMKGVSSLTELGLTPEDLLWAVSRAERVIDGNGWEFRFQLAETRLRMALEATKKSE